VRRNAVALVRLIGRAAGCSMLLGAAAAAAAAQPTAPLGLTAAVKSAVCPQAELFCVPPEVLREFRGVWVATVGNMDWPSRPGLPADSARVELVRILDQAVWSGLNAVVFQIRPAGDALYASKIEPWSEYLTGKQGLAPVEHWDPLTFAVKEAHARGLELHAWFNPYRAKDPTAKGPLAAMHMANQYPAFAKRYGHYTWFDPGEPAVRRRTVRVVLDVLARYDVDGIHFDDYFYPYPEQRRRKDIPFPDATSFKRYQKQGGSLERDDWRRRNVDLLIDTLRTEIAKVKPWVKFGVSPFGIWRPGEPSSVRGFDAYSKIFADARKWLVNGWVDYLVPQLYWAIAQDGQAFGELLRWWKAQNPQARHVWPGLADYKIGDGRVPWQSGEILRQIDTTRVAGGSVGTVHFQMKALLQDRDSVATRLARGPYAAPALVPASPWMGRVAPRTPAIAIAGASTGDILTIARSATDDVKWWLVQTQAGGAWTTRVMDGALTQIAMVTFTSAAGAPEILAVTPVGRTGVAGSPIAIRVR